MRKLVVFIICVLFMTVCLPHIYFLPPPSCISLSQAVNVLYIIVHTFFNEFNNAILQLVSLLSWLVWISYIYLYRATRKSLTGWLRIIWQYLLIGVKVLLFDESKTIFVQGDSEVSYRVTQNSLMIFNDQWKLLVIQWE